MHEMIETIRAAVADGATPEQKANGALACRTLLAALEAETGKAIALPGAPTPGPLAGLAPDQALDLIIARLSAIAEKQEPAPESKAEPASRPLRIALVPTPPRAPLTTRRKP